MSAFALFSLILASGFLLALALAGRRRGLRRASERLQERTAAVGRPGEVSPEFALELEALRRRILEWVEREPGRFTVEGIARRMAWLPAVGPDPALADEARRLGMAAEVCRKLLLTRSIAAAGGRLWPASGQPPVSCRLRPRPSPDELRVALDLHREEYPSAHAAAPRLRPCLCRS